MSTTADKPGSPWDRQILEGMAAIYDIEVRPEQRDEEVRAAIDRETDREPTLAKAIQYLRSKDHSVQKIRRTGRSRVSGEGDNLTWQRVMDLAVRLGARHIDLV